MNFKSVSVDGARSANDWFYLRGRRGYGEDNDNCNDGSHEISGPALSCC
jgi:hypothetical protein